MIIGYTILLMLLLVTFIAYITPWWLGVVSWVVLTTISLVWIYRISYWYLDKPEIPRFKVEQIANYLEPGDIINNTLFKARSKVWDIHHLINTRFTHIAMVTRENNQLYVVDAVSNRSMLHPDFLMVKSTFKSYLDGLHWVIMKIPIEEYLMAKGSQVMRIFRHPKKRAKVKPNHLQVCQPFRVINKKMYYCSYFIGKILEEQGIISKSPKLFPYRVDELIDKLQEVGYTSTVFVSHG